MKKNIIFIIGPTAVGKTDLSIDLAEKLKTEIISCDSRQIYKELLIGTAPPNKKQLSTIKHHFIQEISIKDYYNAGKFEVEVIKKINLLHKNRNTIIIVGGSGLYVDAICKGFDKIPETSKSLRKKLNKEVNEKGIVWLEKEVQKIDPKFYLSCDKKNPQRLLRALEVYLETGMKISSLKTRKKKKRPFNIIKIGLNINRDILYERINKRVDNMIEAGLVDEVANLIKHKHYNALQTVGYKEIFQFLNHDIKLDQAIIDIKKNTRRFAKRQLTWFRKDEEIKWFNPKDLKEIEQFIGL